MRKKRLFAVCCAAGMLCLTGCQPEKTFQTKTTEEQTTEEETTEEKTTEEETTKEETTKRQSAEMQTQRSEQEMQTPEPSPALQTEVQSAPQTEAPVQQAETEVFALPAPPVYEEEYLQCPYCAQWFSAQPDGDLWNPYDRHILEERDRHEGGQATEQEMVQCPDCLNWYEAGNIFRNHICNGK